MTSDAFELPPLELGTYQHYKGNLYTVLGVGRHTETGEYLVVYSPVEQKSGMPAFWLRPYAMFIETVTVDGKEIPRFRKVEE